MHQQHPLALLCCCWCLSAPHVGLYGVGTGVSKEAAKMVLADDSSASIVTTMRVGGRAWDNIRDVNVCASARYTRP